MAVTAVDLSPLCLPPSVTEPQDKAQAYQMLLQEGGLLYYAGKATPALLKLLFQTVTTPGLASLTQQVMWLGGKGDYEVCLGVKCQGACMREYEVSQVCKHGIICVLLANKQGERAT
jgi:hypothetical protein